MAFGLADASGTACALLGSKSPAMKQMWYDMARLEKALLSEQ